MHKWKLFKKSAALVLSSAVIASGVPVTAMASEAEVFSDVSEETQGDPAEAVPVGIVVPHAAVVKIEVVQVAHPIVHLTVAVVVEQHPFQLLIVPPFNELREFISHEAELLAGMRHQSFQFRSKA